MDIVSMERTYNINTSEDMTQVKVFGTDGQTRNKTGSITWTNIETADYILKLVLLTV